MLKASTFLDVTFRFANGLPVSSRHSLTRRFTFS